MTISIKLLTCWRYKFLAERKAVLTATPIEGRFRELRRRTDLLVALSARPGGDCDASHSDGTAKCYPLKVEVRRPREGALAASSWSGGKRRCVSLERQRGI